jgi:hypothetical protein
MDSLSRKREELSHHGLAQGRIPLFKSICFDSDGYWERSLLLVVRQLS